MAIISTAGSGSSKARTRSESAICGTAAGDTKETASIWVKPAAARARKKSALTSGGICCGMACQASRGHSMILTGVVLTAAFSGHLRPRQQPQYAEAQQMNHSNLHQYFPQRLPSHGHGRVKAIDDPLRIQHDLRPVVAGLLGETQLRLFEQQRVRVEEAQLEQSIRAHQGQNLRSFHCRKSNRNPSQQGPPCQPSGRVGLLVFSLLASRPLGARECLRAHEPSITPRAKEDCAILSAAPM